mmetsp:Transcript_84544/g.137040  ORF Transcript_84544/g.137040 Transcript_84544/m.137040 type:complete len:465 (-) Transcript_84544:443-1837(-)
MRDGSCTNLSGGLFQGIAQQQSNTYIDWDDLAPAASTNSSADAWVMVEDDMVSLSSASSVSSMSSLANHLDGASLASHAGALPLQPTALAGMRPPRPMRGSRGCVTSTPSPRPIFGGVMPPPSRAVEEDAVRSVFLFTDGMANVGLRDQAIVAATKKMLDANPQVKIFTFGFGSDHDEKLLLDIASAGQGSYYYIEKEDQIAAAFGDALGGLLSVAAQNVIVEFSTEQGAGIIIDRLHTPFKTTHVADGRQVCCGDLLSEECKDILVDLLLPAAFNTGELKSGGFKIGTLKVSYFDVASAGMQATHIDLVVHRAHVVPVDMEANLHVSLQRARVETVAALEQAAQLADEGDFDGAREQLEQRAQLISALIKNAENKGDTVVAAIARVLVADIEEAINGARDEHVFATHGSKAMRMKGACRSAQRCDFTSPTAPTTGRVDEDEEVSRFSSGSKRQRQTKGSAGSI